MSKITKAVITAAGPKQQHLPFQTLVSPSGEAKTVIAFQLDEIFSSGIDSVAIVISPGTLTDFQKATLNHREKVTFIEQAEPRGYGHAVLAAADFIAGDRFLLMVSDHLYLSRTDTSCLGQLVKIAAQTEASISAVQATHESQLPLYGTLTGNRIPGQNDLYEITHLIEKPTPTIAEQELIVPGLRAGHYLCFFGMHILTPDVIQHLHKTHQNAPEALLPLTPSLAASINLEPYLAFEIKGLRFNIEEPYGLLRAQLGMALSGHSRDEIMGDLIQLIASTRS